MNGLDDYDRGFIKRIVKNVRRVSEGDLEHANERDRLDWEGQLAEIEGNLTRLSSHAIGLLLMVVESGISYQCDCGRIIEVAGDRTVTLRGTPHGMPHRQP